MFAAALVALLIAAPSQAKECKRDVEFALKELDKQCGHFFKTKGISWPKVRKEMLKGAKQVKNDQDEYMLLVRLIARLRDGHAAVRIEPAAQGAKWPDQGERRGPAVFFTVVEGKRVVIKNSWGDAEKAGVTPGMEVMQIDGEPALKWLTAKELEIADLWSFSTDQQRRFFTCHWGLAGPTTSRLKLELRRPDGKRKKATLARTSKSYVPWGPVFFPNAKELKRIGRQSYGKTENGYGYIHLRDTKGELPNQIDTALAAIGDVPGLILDCRANGGGGCDHDAVFGRFVPTGKTLSFGKKYASQGPKQYSGPMVVIVDAGVRSAGETISGMFKEDGRALMIGPQPTAGMSSSKTTIALPSKKFSLYVSVHSNKARFNGGKGIEGIGVPPHEFVDYDPKELAEGVDTLIRRAEELLAEGSWRQVPYKPERFGWKKP